MRYKSPYCRSRKDYHKHCDGFEYTTYYGKKICECKCHKKDNNKK